jgi:hypothetical protein
MMSKQSTALHSRIDRICADFLELMSMGVVFTANYFFSGRRRPRRQQCVLGDRLHKSQDQVGSVFRMCS